MNEANADQIEYWNGKAGERWARRQDRIDASLAEVTKRALPFAEAAPGERVLDIGCGCGTTTLALAKAVGATGAVRGVDISHPMLEVARRRAAEAGLAIAFDEADASDCAFTPDRDLVFSRFGVMFFADPPGAFANIRKALKPSGRLRFVCWRTAGENLWATAPFQAARDLLPPQEAPDPNAPGPFAFGDGDRLAGILQEAGYRDIAIDRLDSVMVMGADAEEAAREALVIGPLARAAADLDEAAVERVRETVAKAMQAYKTDLGITPPAACWLVGAKA